MSPKEKIEADGLYERAVKAEKEVGELKKKVDDAALNYAALEGEYKELKEAWKRQSDDFLQTDWRECPCGKRWPHPACSSFAKCYFCHAHDAKEALAEENARLKERFSSLLEPAGEDVELDFDPDDYPLY